MFLKYFSVILKKTTKYLILSKKILKKTTKYLILSKKKNLREDSVT